MFEATRPISTRPRPNTTWPRPRPRPNNLASRPHRPRGLNIPGLYYDQHGAYYPRQAPAPTAAYYGYPHAGVPTQSASQQVGVTQELLVVVQPVRIQSFVAHIILLCFVFWCCGCLFRLIAFDLDVPAKGQAASAPQSARQLGIASLVLSIIGIVVGIIIIIIVIIVVFGVAATATYHAETSYKPECTQYFGGDC